MKKYQIIYADPPYSYKENWGNNAVHHQYKSLSLDDICALPIQRIADTNCHLYLWVTNPMLAEGLVVTKAWGFEYKQLLTWIKTYADNSLTMGMGYYFRTTTEQCIFAIKGKLPRIRKDIPNAFYAPRTKHSKKPEVFRDIIIQQSGDLPRIELFARQKVEGWDCWGSEVESDIEL